MKKGVKKFEDFKTKTISKKAAQTILGGRRGNGNNPNVGSGN